MSALENINISFSANPLLIISGILLVALFSYYINRVTIPPVSKSLKYLLYSIRVLALSLLVFLLFEPILTLEFLETKQSKSLVFIDNSKSIVAEDSSARQNVVIELLNDVEKQLSGSIDYFKFGSNVKNITTDFLHKIF